MPKKFLNVKFKAISTRIDVTDMEDLSEIRRAIKTEFGDAIPVGPAFIRLYDRKQGKFIIELGEISEEFNLKLNQEKDNCLTVGKQ